ncbi:MAG TPA: hypothetical protein VGM27_04165, partial [Acidobacteriaceae bacterium]
LEGMALALERRFEPFSQGRGFITQERVEEIETIAARHGIYLAPLYNADGPVEDRPECQTEWSESMSGTIHSSLSSVVGKVRMRLPVAR